MGRAGLGHQEAAHRRRGQGASCSQKRGGTRACGSSHYGEGYTEVPGGTDTGRQVLSGPGRLPPLGGHTWTCDRLTVSPSCSALGRACCSRSPCTEREQANADVHALVRMRFLSLEETHPEPSLCPGEAAAQASMMKERVTGTGPPREEGVILSHTLKAGSPLSGWACLARGTSG